MERDQTLKPPTTRRHDRRRDDVDSRGDATREALVDAGLELFSKLGYHAASSRALAEAAGVNQALIGYHFGGKRGLYLAVFERIGESVVARLGPAVAMAQQADESAESPPDRDAIVDGILQMLDRAVDLFTGPATAPWAMLIIREQQNPTEAFDIVWQRFMAPLTGRLARWIGILRGEPADAPQVRLTVLTIMSQALMFRVARETVLRLLGWDAIGADEVAGIKRRIHHNVRAILAEETP